MAVAAVQHWLRQLRLLGRSQRCSRQRLSLCLLLPQRLLHLQRLQRQLLGLLAPLHQGPLGRACCWPLCPLLQGPLACCSAALRLLQRLCLHLRLLPQLSRAALLPPSPRMRAWLPS